MNVENKSFVIIPAAGLGIRAKTDLPKQYVSINGKPILLHTIERFLHLPWIEKIVIALHPDDGHFQQLIKLSNSKIVTVIGGNARQASVLNALEILQQWACAQDWVYVHDAVRPCLDSSDLQQLRQSLQNHPIGGILAQPVQDTLKEVIDNQVQKTINRDLVWRALTPQVFRFQILLQSILNAQNEGILFTDECACLEKNGFLPKVVLASCPNPKFTYPNDLSYVEFLLQNQAEEVLQ